MRWSRAPITLILLAASRSARAQSVQGAPTEGVDSVPVMDGASATPNVARQGVPSSVLDGANSVPVTYNDGLYTPWTPTSQAEATQASIEPTQATSQAAVTASPASSIYLQPTSAASPSVTMDTLSSETAESTEASTELSTSSTPSTSSTSTLSNSPSSSTISFASRSTRSSTSASTTGTATPFNDSAGVSSGSRTNLTAILPVALSLGVLALLLGILLFFVWRRRQRKRRMLESRRYNVDDTEKAGFRYTGNAHDDDFEEDDEKGPGQWTTFNQTPRYDDVEKGFGMAGLGSAASPVYRMNEQRESSERGWQWGANEQQNPLKQSRGPLPSTPQAASTDLQRADTLESLHADLDAMIAESRTGYEPRQTSENTGTALGRTASAIYSSLSGRGNRYGSRASSRSAYSSGPGSWNEHGVWELENDLDNTDDKKKRAHLQERSDDGQGRPLLACVDETPRKKGYSTYTPPESPSRNSGRDSQTLHGDDDTAMTVAGGSSMQYSLSDSNTAPMRRVTLRDNPVPAFSPSTAGGGTPRRWRSKTLSQSDCDSPSLYSPSTNGHGAFSPPTALQPGKSPAIGSRPASPAIQTHPYYKAYNQPTNSALTQSTKSGTTYSLSGMAGLLYNKDASPSDGSYTNLPPRKPRRKSTLAKTRPDIPGVTVTAASATDSHNPHRAVSRVIQQSRARGSSISSQSSENSIPKQPWNSRIRSELRESTSSGSSIDELLNNVLGSTRSPA